MVLWGTKNGCSMASLNHSYAFSSVSEFFSDLLLSHLFQHPLGKCSEVAPIALCYALSIKFISYWSNVHLFIKSPYFDLSSDCLLISTKIPNLCARA